MMKPLAGRAGPELESAGAESDQVPWQGGGPGGPPGSGLRTEQHRYSANPEVGGGPRGRYANATGD